MRNAEESTSDNHNTMLEKISLEKRLIAKRATIRYEIQTILTKTRHLKREYHYINT